MGSKELRVGKCSSPDSGIHVDQRCHYESPPAPSPPPRPPLLKSGPPSPAMVPRRNSNKSSSLRLERQRKRPMSDIGLAAFLSSVALADSTKDDVVCHRVMRRTRSDSGGIRSFARDSSQQRQPLLQLTRMRSERRLLIDRASRRQRGPLRRSVSQPVEMDKLGSVAWLSQCQGFSDQEDNVHEDMGLASSDDDETSSDGEMGMGRNPNKFARSQPGDLYAEYVTYAEALWDHVTMDPEELPLKVGDLVEVLDCMDREWWWGAIGDRDGWFPASFVRPKVNQEDTVEDCVARMDSGQGLTGNRKTNVSLLSNDQVRANVIKEIFATERDFVKHLKDVIEGYLKQVRKRPDMFPEERVGMVFSNLEQLHVFQSQFLLELEECINWDQLHLSQIGAIFVKHKEGFQMYSDYCNNHPQAVSELQEMFSIPKYSHFFEACRLLQDMIDISLDGFLLTPVQKICKYPLQLAELLKYTRSDHPDHPHVAEALDTMRSVAQYINERKRRMECLEKLAAWQAAVEYWEGPNLLDTSSELIHSGEVCKLSSSWSRDVTLFLFDHQLIINKKDLLKRNTFCYKGRIEMDTSEVVDLPDGRDIQTGLSVKNAWKVFCSARNKWLTFCTKTVEEKERWMMAFCNERSRVADDREQGFVVSEKAKKSAIMAVKNRLKRPKSKNGKDFSKRRMTHANVIQHPTVKAKTTSLPHGVIRLPGSSNGSSNNNNKKKQSGWFMFGSSKKQKR